MKAVAIVLAAGMGFSCAGMAQQVAAPAASAPVTATAAGATPVDAQLHATVLKFLEVMDLRNKMIEGQKAAMPEAEKKLMDSSSEITQQFADEWGKRMLADVRIDAYMSAIAAIYEKHFTVAEIEQLTEIQREANDKKTPVIPDALKAKLAKEGIEVQSEIVGACSQIGARQGGEVAQDIVKEHPEWLKSGTADTAAPKKE
jgi:biotin carboxyl carrier protein